VAAVKKQRNSDRPAWPRKRDLTAIRTALVAITLTALMLPAILFISARQQCQSSNEVRREAIPEAFAQLIDRERTK
jgi:hypothetical protein